MPRFSIIITCYNQSAFIRQTVDSVLAQKYPAEEIIVVDDCSTDSSRKCLEEYGSAIKLMPLATNQGACAARNQGAMSAEGDFLVFLDGDDLLWPWALEVYSRIVEAKQPKLILSNMFWFEGQFSKTDVNWSQRDISIVDYDFFMKKDRSWRASASAMVVDRISFNQVGGWAMGLFPVEDIDLAFRLGYAGRTIQIVEPVTVAYRVHTTNVTRQTSTMTDASMLVVRREKTGIYPGGRECRLERYAAVGGPAFFALKNAFKKKLYRKAFALLAIAWPLIVVAIIRKTILKPAAARPLETLPMIHAEFSRAEAGS